MVSIDRPLLKGRLPRFSADFAHPLDKIIAIGNINIHNAG
jgi:hypothetical protein